MVGGVRLAKGFGLKMTKDDAIPVQLAKIGLKPEDIKYVVVGHLHLDHGGNVGQFKNSTLIAQDDEFKAAWWPDVGYSVYYIPGDFADTKNMKTIRLNGDFDLFDDGSVRIIRAPGHTPGSQFMVVKLPKTGTAILTSDVVYLQESLDKNLIPPIPGTWSPGDMYRQLREDPAYPRRRERQAVHRPRSGALQGGEEGAGVLRLSRLGARHLRWRDRLV